MQCKKCNAELTDEQRFCSYCGEAVNKCSAEDGDKEQENYLSDKNEKIRPVFCRACGVELTPEAAFCSACGVRVDKRAVTREKCFKDISEKASDSRLKKGGLVREIIKKSTVVFVSLLLLIFSFLPVATHTLEPYTYNLEHDAYDVRLNAFDYIVLCFDAMYSMDADDIEESDAYDEYLEWVDVLRDDDLDDDELEEAYSNVIYYQLKLMLANENANFRFVYLLSAVFALALVLMALAVFVLSVLDLILFLTKKNFVILGKLVKNFLAIIPMLAILLYAAGTYSYFAPVSLLGEKATTSISATSVFAIVLSLGVLAYLAVDRIFFSGKIRVNTGEIVRRSLSSVFACIMLFTVFMPFISFNVKTAFNGKDKTESASVSLDASYFGEFDITEEALEEYDDLTESEAFLIIRRAFGFLGGYTKKEFLRGESNSENRIILNNAFVGFGGEDYAWVMAMIPVVALLIGIIAAVLLWQNLIAVVEGTSPRGSLTITVRIIAIVLAVITVAFVTVFVMVSSYNLDLIGFSGPFGRGHTATVSISAGAILALVSAVAVMSVPMGKNNEEFLTSVEE